jgi:hypothetical protein
VLCASPHDPRGMVGMEAMSDPAKLEALRKALEPRLIAPEFLPLYEAAAAYLALLESDAIVIRRDSEGNWPFETAKVIYDILAADLDNERDRLYLADIRSTVILDALAESSKETPEVEKNQLGMW